MAIRAERTWGIYGRTAEQAEIERIIAAGRRPLRANSGRRRIGKATLIQRALRAHRGLGAFYFPVPDGDERGVVQAFQDAVEDSGAAAEVGTRIRTIDEFQYVHHESLAPFTSFVLARADRLRDTRKGGLFVLGLRKPR